MAPMGLRQVAALHLFPRASGYILILAVEGPEAGKISTPADKPVRAPECRADTRPPAKGNAVIPVL